MPTQTIANPAGALQNVSDFRTQQTVDGEVLRDGTELFAEYRANAAVTKGMVLQLVQATQTVPLSCTPMATAGVDGRAFLGVAENNAAVGRMVKVCTNGITLVNVGATTAAFLGSITLPGTTAGIGAANATALAATDVVGTIFATALGTKDATTNLVPARINQF